MTIDIDEAKVNRNEVGLWLGWTLATGAGMAVGFLPSIFLVETLGLGLSRVIFPILAGVLIGFGQWLVLRNFITKCSDWILAAGAGWGIGFALGILVLQLLPGGAWLRLFGYVLFGLIIALVQWPVLRREIPQILPWVIANIAGWTLGFYLGQLSSSILFDSIPESLFLTALLNNTISGIVAGALTGLVLVWIVRKPERPDLQTFDQQLT